LDQKTKAVDFHGFFLFFKQFFPLSQSVFLLHLCRLITAKLKTRTIGTYFALFNLRSR